MKRRINRIQAKGVGKAVPKMPAPSSFLSDSLCPVNPENPVILSLFLFLPEFAL